jgi:hypothetical protein
VPTLQTDWTATRAAIITWIGELSGLPTYWRDDGNPHVDPSDPAHILLHISTLDQRGANPVLYDESTGDTGAKYVVPKVVRLVDVTLDVSLIAGWQVPGSTSTDLLSAICMRAELAEVSDALDDTAIALNRVNPIATVDFMSHDGYQLSQATSQWGMCLHDVYQSTDVAVEAIETAVPDPNELTS